MSEDVIELLIYHQPSVKPSLTLRPFGVLGYVAGHSLTLPATMALIGSYHIHSISSASHCHMVTSLSMQNLFQDSCLMNNYIDQSCHSNTPMKRAYCLSSDFCDWIMGTGMETGSIDQGITPVH